MTKFKANLLIFLRFRTVFVRGLVSTGALLQGVGHHAILLYITLPQNLFYLRKFIQKFDNHGMDEKNIYVLEKITKIIFF